MISRKNLLTTIGALISALGVVQPAVATTGYSVSLDDNALYKITLETGEATKLGPVVMSGGVGARNIQFRGVIELEFTPDGRLFGLDRDRDSLIHINPFTGYVMEEFPLTKTAVNPPDLPIGTAFGAPPILAGIDHVPEHVGFAWYDASVPNAITQSDTLMIAVGGIPNEANALYSIDQYTGKTDLVAAFAVNSAGDPFEFLHPIMAMKQQNPLNVNTSGGVTYEVSSGGQVGAGEIISPNWTTDEFGTSYIDDAQGNHLGEAWIATPDQPEWIHQPDLPDLPIGLAKNGLIQNNIFIEMYGSPDSTITYASTITTSGVGNFASLAIARPLNGPITEYGDANLDGKVDAADLNIMALNWNKPLIITRAGHWRNGDFNGDNIVNAADLNLLALHWRFGVEEDQQSLFSVQDAFTQAMASLNIPEPGTALMAALLSMLWVGRFGSRQS